MVISGGISAYALTAVTVLVPVITGGYFLWMLKRVDHRPRPTAATDAGTAPQGHLEGRRHGDRALPCPAGPAHASSPSCSSRPPRRSRSGPPTSYTEACTPDGGLHPLRGRGALRRRARDVPFFQFSRQAAETSRATCSSSPSLAALASIVLNAVSGSGGSSPFGTLLASDSLGNLFAIADPLRHALRRRRPPSPSSPRARRATPRSTIPCSPSRRSGCSSSRTRPTSSCSSSPGSS